MLSEFAKIKRKAIRLYKEFMLDEVDGKVEKFYKSKKQSTVLGTESFLDKMKERFRDKKFHCSS